MEVNSLPINKVFSSGGDIQYILPHFQREYAWEKENWRTLIEDIFSIYENYEPHSPPEHFLGAMVVINDGTRAGTIPAFKLVDGQQRLTTISILLSALAFIVKERDASKSLYKKIRKQIINPDEEGELRYKIMPTTKYGDREVFFAIVDEKDTLPQNDSRIPTAFAYLAKELNTRIEVNDIDPEQLFIVITNCLHVVFINLDNRERPYEIFESLNAKGKPLTQPDLVRNYIAMRLPEDRQRDIFENHWSKIEHLLRENRTVARIGELTAFLRHYLAFQNGKLPNKDHVYARFRDRIEREYPTADTFIEEIRQLHDFAVIYDRFLRPENEPNPAIRKAIERLNILETRTAYPFLMAAYSSMQHGETEIQDFIAGLHILENYIIRRYLAGEPTNYTNKMFPTLWREIEPTAFASSLKVALLRKNYPSDETLQKIIPLQKLYDKRQTAKLVLILSSINAHLSRNSGGYTILDGEATIEHIMPQQLSPEWKMDLGKHHDEIHRELLNTLGNLTLVTREWNSSLSNSNFAKKQQKLSRHALLLNQRYFDTVTKWDGESIEARTQWLTQQVMAVWQAFGEPEPTPIVTGKKPKALLFLGETHRVSSWRDVVTIMAECTIEIASDFEAIAKEMNAFFSQIERDRSRQLSNGWWLYVNISAKTAIEFCEKITTSAEVPDEEWEVITS